MEYHLPGRMGSRGQLECLCSYRIVFNPVSTMPLCSRQLFLQRSYSLFGVNAFLLYMLKLLLVAVDLPFRNARRPRLAI